MATDEWSIENMQKIITAYEQLKEPMGVLKRHMQQQKRQMHRGW